MGVVAWPRQSCPVNALERACPRASLGPSRPSFIDEVHAGGTACALSQVRIQTSCHLGSGPIATRGEYMTVPRNQGNRKHEIASATPLPAIRPMVAGLDVGSSEHWVCGPGRADGIPNVRGFGTTTDQLHALADWLAEQGVESLAMESTSVYWIPIYELLESRGIEVVLVNARQLHNVPGRKTDVSDCQWLQLLHSCGLLRGSFRPGEAITRLRALHRQLANLVAERTRCVQWMQKALDQMNVQVHRAVTDLTGVTGMAIVRAIVGGERDPARLARHRDRRCGKSAAEIARYLTGTWRDEHLFNLASTLRLFDALETEIAAYEAQLLKEVAALPPGEVSGQRAALTLEHLECPPLAPRPSDEPGEDLVVPVAVPLEHLGGRQDDVPAGGADVGQRGTPRIPRAGDVEPGGHPAIRGRPGPPGPPGRKRAAGRAQAPASRGRCRT